MADKVVGDLDRGGEALVLRGVLRVMVVADGVGEFLGQLVALEEVGADLGVVPSDELALEDADVGRRLERRARHLGKLSREGIGHDDLAHVVQEADQIVGVIIDDALGRGEDLPGEDRRPDAVRPEILPADGTGVQDWSCSISSMTGVATENSRIWRRPRKKTASSRLLMCAERPK